MAPPDGRRPVGRARVLLATGFGLGYSPVIPGTVGSLPGLLLSWGLWTLGGWPLAAAGATLVAGIGFWAAEGGARHLGETDPGPVVIDEIAGQMVTLLFIAPTTTSLLVGFFLFRVFDVLKPFPARRLEALPGGSGIMADDLMAGVYANVSLHAVLPLLSA